MIRTSEKRRTGLADHEELPWSLRDVAGQKPFAFAAGDTNLYRYVGNSPTNATDPNGLVGHWETIGTVKGPKFATIAVLNEVDSMPHIRWNSTEIVYQQVRGRATDLPATGVWGNPGGPIGSIGGALDINKSTADGGARMVNVKDFGGVESWVTLNGTGQGNGICNTIDNPTAKSTKTDQELYNAGSIRVLFWNFKPGKYQVTFRYKIGVQASGNLGSRITLVYNDNGASREKFFAHGAKGQKVGVTKVTGWFEDITTTLVVSPNLSFNEPLPSLPRNSNALEVVKLRLITSGMKGWASTNLELDILSITPVGGSAKN